MKAVGVLTSLLWALGSCAAAAGQGRDWTAQDSLAVRYFVTDWAFPGFLAEARPDREVAKFSPDGRHFFFVSIRGDVAEDRTEYTLWIYSTQSVRQALRSTRGGRSAPQ